MGNITIEIIIVALLIMANGVFALAEVSVVAARKARLQQRAQEGDVKARVALELAESPSRFLATVQIGITLIGISAGAFGGTTLSKALANFVRSVPSLEPYADSIGLGVVVVAITYLSVIIGELVPKRIGLNNPERIASLIAMPMRAMSVVASPLVSFLSFSTDLVLRMIRLRASEESSVTEEEINVMMEQGREAGVFAEAEQDMVGRIFRLGDRNVSSLMTRRSDITWLDLEDSWETNRRKLTGNLYSRLPVGLGGLDEVIGFVRAKDLLDEVLKGQPPELTASLQTPIFVPETLPAFKLLESFKVNRTHLIFVVNEHGAVEGMVTLHDILGAIVGDLPSVDESDEPPSAQREDGSWLLEGALPIHDFKKIFQRVHLPGDVDGNYHTLSGFAMMQMGRIPITADHFDFDGLRFEIVDMDGHRVDKILVRQLPDADKTDL